MQLNICNEIMWWQRSATVITAVEVVHTDSFPTISAHFTEFGWNKLTIKICSDILTMYLVELTLYKLFAGGNYEKSYCYCFCRSNAAQLMCL